MAEQGLSLEAYGSAVARFVRGAVDGEPPPVGRDGRDALLRAARTLDRASLARFGESFLRAYDAERAPAPTEQPPRPIDDEPAPRLTLHDYATLRADCMTGTVPLGDVLARHGLDEASDRAEVAAWGRRFKRDPALFEQYKALFQEMRHALQPSAVASPAAVPAITAPLTMHQYASLRAECINARPEELEGVRARYGLDDVSDAAEVGRWMRKFDEDPALFEQYKKLFQYLRHVVHA